MLAAKAGVKNPAVGAGLSSLRSGLGSAPKVKSPMSPISVVLGSSTSAFHAPLRFRGVLLGVDEKDKRRGDDRPGDSDTCGNRDYVVSHITCP